MKRPLNFKSPESRARYLSWKQRQRKRFLGVDRSFCPVCDQPFADDPNTIIHSPVSGPTNHKCPHCGAIVTSDELATAKEMDAGAYPTPGFESHRPVALELADRLLEHCGHCDSPTEVMLKPQDINLNAIPAEEKQKGIKVEKEHVIKAKDALAIAAGHWKEDPRYYQHGQEKDFFPELPEKAKTYLAGIDSLGL